MRAQVLGLAAMGLFWLVLLGHFKQVMRAHRTEKSNMTLWLSLLLWANSMSFIGMGLADPIDPYMVGSRVPAVVLCILSAMQSVRPRLSARLLVANVMFNFVVGDLMWLLAQETGLTFETAPPYL